MSHTRPLVLFALIATLAMILGCSGGSPTSPDFEAGTLDSIPVIGLSQVGDMFNAVGLLGAYELLINPEDMTADFVAKRTTSAIGDSYVISGLPFFTMTPCQNCVELTGVRLTSDGDAVLSFAIRHPFKMGSMSLPPTAANRRDLDIFDVAAVLVPIGGTATAYTALGSVYDTICVGPAGYTKELANLFTPADNAAMPFFLVKDDSIDAVPPVSTYNKFAMGGSDNFDATFNLDSGSLKFNMYLTFGYGAAAKGSDKPSFLAPKYFNPEFNRKNAWKVAVTPLTVPWFDNMPAEEKNIEIKVWDWQVGATVSTTTPYADETVKTKVYEASTVTKVEIELFGDTGEALAATSGLGTPISPLVYDVTIANSLSRPAGDYIGLVKVSDSRTPAAAFTEGQDFLIDTPDGMALNNVLMGEFATYQTFDAEIIVGCGPIILGTVTGCPVAPILNNSNLDFTVTASSFMTTQISYEIDSDYDGVTFMPDGPGNTTGIFNGVNFNSSPCLIGDTFDVAVQMTDDCPTPNVTVFEICTVEIGTCCGPIVLGTVTGCPVGPVANNNNLDFTVTASSYQSTQISYEMDSDYDGTTFMPDGPSNTTGIFNGVNFNSSPCLIGDTFDVAVRMTDNCPTPNVAVFEICTVEISSCCGPIVLGTVTGVPVAPVPNGTTANITVSATSFGATVLTYEIDTDYDGTTFAPDGPSNTNGIFNEVRYRSFPCVVADTMNVAVRITNDCTPPSVGTFPLGTVGISVCGCSGTSVDPWTTNVTNVGAPPNIRYSNQGISVAPANRQRNYGTESLAYGNGWVYTAFFDSVAGTVYFTRSANSGLNWDPSTPIAGPGLLIEGCSIAAAGSNVFVVYSDRTTGDVILLKNTTSGAGAWTPYTVKDNPSGYYNATLGVAVDSSDPIYVCVQYTASSTAPGSGGLATTESIDRSSDGGATWTPSTVTWSGTQAYTSQIVCASDGTFYAMRVQNSAIRTKRSDDHGATWPDRASATPSPAAWGYGGDICVDPDFPNVVYITMYQQANNTSYSPRLFLFRSLDSCATLTQLQSNLELPIETALLNEMPANPVVGVCGAGSVYVAFSYNLTASLTDYDIYITKSCDAGVTFFTPILVNPPDSGVNDFDVNPEIVLNPEPGAYGVVVTWLENGYTVNTGLTVNPNGFIQARHYQY